MPDSQAGTVWEVSWCKSFLTVQKLCKLWAFQLGIVFFRCSESSIFSSMIITIPLWLWDSQDPNPTSPFPKLQCQEILFVSMQASRELEEGRTNTSLQVISIIDCLERWKGWCGEGVKGGAGMRKSIHPINLWVKHQKVFLTFPHLCHDLHHIIFKTRICINCAYTSFNQSWLIQGQNGLNEPFDPLSHLHRKTINDNMDE